MTKLKDEMYWRRTACGLILGRNFNETAEDYFKRKPEVKKWYDEYLEKAEKERSNHD